MNVLYVAVSHWEEGVVVVLVCAGERDAFAFVDGSLELVVSGRWCMFALLYDASLDGSSTSRISFWSIWLLDMFEFFWKRLARVMSEEEKWTQMESETLGGVSGGRTLELHAPPSAASCLLCSLCLSVLTRRDASRSLSRVPQRSTHGQSSIPHLVH